MKEYEEIVEELGHELRFPLKPGRNGSVVILVEEEMQIVIEPMDDGPYLKIATTLGDLSPGPLRAKIVQNALRANGSPHPRYGIFAYSRQANQLVLFDWIRTDDLTGKLLFQYLEPFTEKAWSWMQGIKEGAIPEPTIRKPRSSRGN